MLMRVTTPVVLCVCAVLACSSPPAFAIWGTNPVTVSSTTVSIPVVEGCGDGAYGAFVAWQEGSPTGVLRVQHLLPDGSLDASWPAAGTIACSATVSRSEVAAVPDRLGGVYLSWKEGNGLYLSRLDPGGNVAAGWPARGRFFGGVFADSPRPVMIEDGAHGVYLAWGSGTSTVLAVHLGPANTGAGGWLGSTRAISVADLMYNTMYWPQIALAPDGGLFVAYAMSSNDEAAAPSAWRLRRITSAGLPASGWPVEGVSIGAFHREFLGAGVKGSLVAVSPDGRGGVFLMIGNPTGTDGYSAQIDNRLYRIQGDGVAAPDWPVGGRVIGTAPGSYSSDLNGSSPDHSYVLKSDLAEGAVVGAPAYYSEFIYNFRLAHYDDSYTDAEGLIGGQEIAERGDGGLFMANFYPTTEPYYYGGVGFISLRQTPSPAGSASWGESHTWEYGTWYGDIGLAATGDGGAVLFWSQVRDRIGLFARRFNPAGEVTTVEPESESRAPLGLSALRFVPGVGVRAAISTPIAARFELFDLAGRRIASQSITAGEVTLAGTAALPSGLYFGRLVAGAGAVAAKLIVAR